MMGGACNSFIGVFYIIRNNQNCKKIACYDFVLITGLFPMGGALNTVCKLFTEEDVFFTEFKSQYV